MHLIKIKITPLSTFVTFPKGDTLFGHFAYHSFMDKEDYFSSYLEDKEPKIIFSDILPNNYVYKPTLPLDSFGVEESLKKEFRKKSWIDIDNLQKGNLTKAKELSFYSQEMKIRNSLSRTTYSTNDSGVFAPYGIEEIRFLYEPVIYIMFNDTFTKEQILQRVNKIGQIGFGKKGTIGKGHFKASIDENFKGFDEVKSKYYLTLSPTLLNKQQDVINSASYNTFNRFGKYHSSLNPFKKPILMADSGAVVKLKYKRKYIGRTINNGIEKESLVQGYSIVVPFKFDGKGL